MNERIGNFNPNSGEGEENPDSEIENSLYIDQPAVRIIMSQEVIITSSDQKPNDPSEDQVPQIAREVLSTPVDSLKEYLKENIGNVQPQKQTKKSK